MSEGSLLAFGCGVAFIAVSGFYVYLRECWTRSEHLVRVKERTTHVTPKADRH